MKCRASPHQKQTEKHAIFFPSKRSPRNQIGENDPADVRRPPSLPVQQSYGIFVRRVRKVAVERERKQRSIV